jgi:hypothetical protein
LSKGTKVSTNGLGTALLIQYCLCDCGHFFSIDKLTAAEIAFQEVVEVELFGEEDRGLEAKGWLI